MKITWVTRSFLDYRIPVFAVLDRLCGHQLTVIYYKDVVPERVRNRLTEILGERAIALTGEIRFSGKKTAPVSTTKPKGVRIPFQPGLITEIKNSTPEVLVADGFFQWTVAALWLRLWNRIPLAICYESTKYTERNAQWFRTVYRKTAAKLIDAVCCNGVLCGEYTQTLGISEEKIIYGNMAADTEFFAQKCDEISQTSVDEFKNKNHWSAPVFLSVGRLVESKGIRHLLEAWKKAAIHGSLVLVGDGSERSVLEKFCKENDLHNVFFCGDVDYDDLPLYYKSADVFIMPTLQDNWSLVVPEAMACGLPIVCSICNGCHPELVRPENGWLFDPMEHDRTAELLQEIASRINEFPAMGKESERIVKNFSPECAGTAIFQTCTLALKNKNK